MPVSWAIYGLSGSSNWPAPLRCGDEIKLSVPNSHAVTSVLTAVDVPTWTTSNIPIHRFPCFIVPVRI